MWDSFKPYLFGGISGMSATCIIQPVDIIKVSIQIKGEELGKLGGKRVHISPVQVAKDIYAANGLRGFYKGLDSALFRQATYTTSRLGLYKQFTDFFSKRNEGKPPTLNQRVFSSMLAGGLGSLIGNPADLSLVRFQNDTTLPPEQRRNYKNVFDAFGRIIREEGVQTLWRGATTTVGRAILLNIGMLVSYDEAKDFFTKWRGLDTITLLLSSAISGFMGSLMSLPADNVRVKLQRMKPDANGVQPYSGMIDCFSQSVRREGITGLWIGFPTYYVRIAPHIMITLLIQEALRHLDTQFIQKKK